MGSSSGLADATYDDLTKYANMNPELVEEPAGSRSTSMASLYAGLDDETLHQLAKQHGYTHHEITELLLAFSVLDVDGSGAVSVAELMEVIGCDAVIGRT